MGIINGIIFMAVAEFEPGFGHAFADTALFENFAVFGLPRKREKILEWFHQ